MDTTSEASRRSSQIHQPNEEKRHARYMCKTHDVRGIDLRTICTPSPTNSIRRRRWRTIKLVNMPVICHRGRLVTSTTICVAAPSSAIRIVLKMNASVCSACICTLLQRKPIISCLSWKARVVWASAHPEESSICTWNRWRWRRRWQRRRVWDFDAHIANAHIHGSQNMSIIWVSVIVIPSHVNVSRCRRLPLPNESTASS